MMRKKRPCEARLFLIAVDGFVEVGCREDSFDTLDETLRPHEWTNTSESMNILTMCLCEWTIGVYDYGHVKFRFLQILEDFDSCELVISTTHIRNHKGNRTL